MAKKLTNLVVHCSDTPFGRTVTADDIFYWHCFPKRNSNGTYTYKGKNYSTVTAIPDDTYVINGQKLSVRKAPNGNGWSVFGYSDLIQVDGELKNLNKYNFDSVIDPWEITNGAAGINSISRHICLAGGGSKLDVKRKSIVMPVTEVFNEKQIETLISYIRMQREVHPDIVIGGHNNHSSKTCPNFDVKKFMIDYKV